LLVKVEEIILLEIGFNGVGVGFIADQDNGDLNDFVGVFGFVVLA
jgi:hypothetical protein